NALTQLTGEVHTGAEQASFQSTNAFLRLLLDPASGYGGRANIGGDPVNIGSHDASVRDFGYAGGLHYRITPDAHGGLCARGRRDQLDRRERARHRTQRRVPGRHLRLHALGRRLRVGGARLCDVLDVDGSFVNVFGTDQLTSNFTAHDFS